MIVMKIGIIQSKKKNFGLKKTKKSQHLLNMDITRDGRLYLTVLS